MGTNDSDPSREIAVRIQERFDFYFLAVSFTLLGLSVQTAKLGVFHPADLCELFGWAFLFIACLTGLARLERVGPLYHLFADIKKWKSVLSDPKVDKLRHREIESEIANRVELKESTTRLFVVLYSVQKIAFVFGIFLVMVARAMPPLLMNGGTVCG